MINKPIDCVAIVSGGMDSITLLHKLVRQDGRHPAVITFRYGQKHIKEIDYAAEHVKLLGCAKHNVIDLTPMSAIFASSALIENEMTIPHIREVLGDPQPPTYVPNRNMLFLSFAVAWGETLGVGDIFYGAQKHDIYGYWDTTPQFLFTLNNVYRLNRKTRVEIQAPFVNMTKTDIVSLGQELGIDYALTWSCYTAGEKACGTCPTCAERVMAFNNLGLRDPLPYALPMEIEAPEEVYEMV